METNPDWKGDDSETDEIDDLFDRTDWPPEKSDVEDIQAQLEVSTRIYQTEIERKANGH